MMSSLDLYPYTRDEIRAYVERRTLVVGDFDACQKTKILRELAGGIDVLPPWQQILLIENGGVNIVGDDDTVNRLYAETGSKDHKYILGFFSSNQIRVPLSPIEKVTLSDVIVWSVNARGNDFGHVTMRHENGHRIDALLAAYMGKKGYYSDKVEAWTKALTQEICRYVPDEFATSPKQLLKAARVLDKYPANVPYEGYRSLVEHLSFYKDSSLFPQEACAEMMAHYATLYAQTGGNENGVHLRLEGLYPDLWPVFRECIIPLGSKLAKELLQEREKRIADYVMEKEFYYNFLSRPFDPCKARIEARLSCAAGTIVQDMDRLKRKNEIIGSGIRQSWEEVVDEFIECCQADMSPPQFVSRIRTGKERQYCAKHRAGASLEEMVDYVLDCETERDLLKDFISAHHEFMGNVGLIYNQNGQISSLPPNYSFWGEFELIKAKRGVEGVLEETKLLRASDGVKKYVDELRRGRAHIERLKSGNTGQKADFPDDFMFRARMEIRDILLSGKVSLEDAAAALSKKNGLLEELSKKVEKLFDKIQSVMGTKAVFLSPKVFADLISEFSNRKSHQEIEGLIKNTQVSKFDIGNYIECCKHQAILDHHSDCSMNSYIVYMQKEGRYVPAMEGFSMDDRLLGEIGRNIVGILLNAGNSGLIQETFRGRDNTHQVIAEILAKNKGGSRLLVAAFGGTGKRRIAGQSPVSGTLARLASRPFDLS